MLKFTLNTKHMNTTTIKPVLALLLALFVTGSALWAQADKSSRPSPPDSTTGKIGEATISINYSSPAVKGRKVWGALVPYGQVWRAGANEATLFATDKDITVEGKQLPAGKYSLFAVPGQDEWKIIFNAQTGQWGTRHDPSKDVLTVSVKPVASASMNERLRYEVTPGGIVLKWENLEVPLSIK